MTRTKGVVVAAAALLAGAAGCRDLSSFTTGRGNSYEGLVVAADFVRAGVDPSTRLCLTIDTDHLQDAPGTLSTNDGRLHAVPMRTIPQIWQDPLSTLSFGEGRLKNLVYMATASTPIADGNGNDVLVIVSLMQSGDVEVRLLRGAQAGATDGAPSTTGGNLFAVFDLSRQSVPCSY
jgi:hypothetical protein